MAVHVQQHQRIIYRTQHPPRPTDESHDGSLHASWCKSRFFQGEYFSMHEGLQYESLSIGLQSRYLADDGVIELTRLLY
jgi:hypothetical protein